MSVILNEVKDPFTTMLFQGYLSYLLLILHFVQDDR